MPIYADYLSVDQDFQPVYSQEVDRTHPSAWRSFIPHEAWLNALDKLLRSLERATGSDRRPLFIHGPYGTGKTHAALVLKHLLEDDLASVRAYFDSWAELRGNVDLWRRLETARSGGDYLVIYRSGTAQITDSFTLLGQVQESVRQALEERGLPAPMTETLYQAVLSKLDGDSSVLNWPGIFEAHRAELGLHWSSPESLLRELRSGPGDESNIKLMVAVHRVLASEGVTVLGDPEQVKAWLKEVIERPGIKGIVFFWDEFADYFSLNSATSTLQELAQLTTAVPFHLCPFLQHSPEIVGRRTAESDWRRLIDRFIAVPYQMAPVTAYKLMAGAIRVRPERREEWEAKREAMFAWVAGAAGMLARESREGESRDDFRDLLPIHPYTAFLLSTISRQFSAAERTLFRWLKEDRPGCFPEYLRREVGDGRDLLTAEWLWDYFFLTDDSELSERTRDVVSYYRSRVDQCQNELEVRAFKAVLLLIALERQMGQVDPRLAPTQPNVTAMLVGTGQAQLAVEALKSLAERDLVHQLAGRDGRYAIVDDTIDWERVRRIEEGLPGFRQLASGQPVGAFAKLVSERLALSDDIAARRQAVWVASAEELTARRERIVGASRAPYQLDAAIVVTLDDQQVYQAEQLARQMAVASPRTVFFVSAIPFGEHRWTEWKRARALELYFQEKRNAASAQVYADKTKHLLTQWGDELATGRLTAFFGHLEQAASGVAGYANFLSRAISETFPMGPELISRVSTLYKNSGFGEKAALVGLGLDPQPANPFRDLVAELQRKGMWESSGFREALKRNPAHPLAAMQEEVDRALKAQGVSLQQLWLRLQGEPYGLMPSHMGVFLMGLLLREYWQGFYWRDGTISYPLSPEKLAERISAAVKGTADTEIRPVTAEAEEFCRLLRGLFPLSPADSRYPDESRKGARTVLQQIGYPLWLLSSGSGPTHAALQALESLLRDTSGDPSGLDDETLRKFNAAVRPAEKLLQGRVSRATLEPLMDQFLERESPAAVRAAAQLGLTTPQVMAKLKALMQEEVWLWRQQQVRDRLPELAGRFELTVALNDLGGNQYSDLDSALQGLQARVKETKLPLSVLASGSEGPMAAVLAGLGQWLRGDLATGEPSRLAAAVSSNREGLRRVLDYPAAALAAWARGELQIELDDEDASEIWGGLADCSARPLADLRQETHRLIDKLWRTRLMRAASGRWKELTGSDSPAAWSRTHSTPVEWLCDSPVAVDIVSRLNQLRSQSIEDLGWLQTALDANAKPLLRLRDENAWRQSFLDLLPSWARATGQVDAEDLRNHVKAKLGSDTNRWGRQAAAQAAEQYLASVHTEKGQPLAERRVREMSAQDAKQTLLELVRDPHIAAMVLERWSRSK